MANTHVIAYSSDGKARIDLTPDARREMSVEPGFDVSPDGRQVAVTWQSTGDDRETDTAIALIDVESQEHAHRRRSDQQQHRIAAVLRPTAKRSL